MSETPLYMRAPRDYEMFPTQFGRLMSMQYHSDAAFFAGMRDAISILRQRASALSTLAKAQGQREVREYRLTLLAIAELLESHPESLLVTMTSGGGVINLTFRRPDAPSVSYFVFAIPRRLHRRRFVNLDDM
jgi:hypothetical protein